MIVGIDASRAFIKKRTGIEEYSYQVISHLKDKLGNCQVVLYINLTNYEIIRKYESTNEFSLPDNWKIKIIKMPRLWTQVGLSLEMLFHPVDVLFVPAHVVPIIHPKNTIVTIHGLEYEAMPEAYSLWERFYMRFSIKMSCRWAKKIIAVSKNTKKDLINLYKVTENKIGVIYEGVSQSESANESESINLRIKNLKPYLLFVGRLEKRKNIEGIIRAFEILKEKYKISHKLILVGGPGHGYEDIKHKAESSKYKAEIILPGFIKETEKYELLKNADAFLFPSFYEGFGLPILEAQGAGAPVITSNAGSLPEVGGGSVLYVDPKFPDFLAETAYSLISNEKLKNEIIKKGHENVARFSWERCASRIAEIIL